MRPFTWCRDGGIERFCRDGGIERFCRDGGIERFCRETATKAGAAQGGSERLDSNPHRIR